MKVVNDVIFLKLCTIFSSIIDAAAIAKHWIIIDRINCKSPASDLLIETALTKTTSRPTIVVIDSPKRLQNFKGPKGDGQIGEKTQKCLDQLESAKKVGIPLGVDDPLPSAPPMNQFYDVVDFLE